jgi:hypothetical protein
LKIGYNLKIGCGFALDRLESEPTFLKRGEGGGEKEEEGYL